MPESLTRVSKFLSLVLRHHPEAIGLTLDEHGWASVDELLRAAKRAGRPLTRETLQKVVERGGKRRFTLSEDGTKIRANYGHSIPIRLDYPPAEPPPILYHGTARRFLKSIRREGLIPKKRLYVHLSSTPETATVVGKRHGRPVVLVIEAGKMHADGHIFYHSPDNTWLTERVPVEYIRFPKTP